MAHSSFFLFNGMPPQGGEKGLGEAIIRKAGTVLKVIGPAIEKEHILDDPNEGEPADRYERGWRLQQALYYLAAAARVEPQDEALIETCLRIWRAPLGWKRWQPAGWSNLAEGSQKMEDGEGPGTAAVLSMLVLGEPFLRPWLNEDDYRRMEERIGEHCGRIQEDIYTGRSWFFGGAEGEDIPLGSPFTAVAASLLLGALAMGGRDGRAGEWRSLATDLLIRSMKETGEDGSYFGGIGEALPVLAEAYLAAVMLARRGDNRLAGIPLLQNAPWWLLDTTLPDRQAWLPFNFNSAVSTKDNALCQRIFLLALTLQPNSILNWYLHQVLGGPSADIFGLAFYQADLPQEEPTASEAVLLMLPHINWLRTSPNRLLMPNLRTEAAHPDRKVVHYPMQGVIVYRSGFGRGDSLLAFKGGWAARGPDHFDRNSLLFYDGDQPVLVEAGGQAEESGGGGSYQRMLSAHNTLQIDGSDLIEGTAKVSGHEWVWVEEDGRLSIKGDAGAAYAQILHFVRTVQVEEKEGTICKLTIRDEILPSDDREHRAALWFHMPAARLEGEKVVIFTDDSRWELTIEEISSPKGEPVKYTWQEEPAGEGKFAPTAFTARGMIPATGVRIVFHLQRWNSESKTSLKELIDHA